METTDLTPPISEHEEDNLRLASQMASVNLLYAQRQLAERIIDPTITTKGLLDIAEHSYKVSGMAKKQEAKDTASRFSIVINLPGGGEVTLGTGNRVIDADPVTSLAQDAQAILDFATAPEFSSANTTVDDF